MWQCEDQFLCWAPDVTRPSSCWDVWCVCWWSPPHLPPPPGTSPWWGAWTGTWRYPTPATSFASRQTFNTEINETISLISADLRGEVCVQVGELSDSSDSSDTDRRAAVTFVLSKLEPSKEVVFTFSPALLTPSYHNDVFFYYSSSSFPRGRDGVTCSQEFSQPDSGRAQYWLTPVNTISR